MPHHKVTKDTKGEEGTAGSHRKDAKSAENGEDAGTADEWLGEPLARPWGPPSRPSGLGTWRPPEAA